MTNRYICDLRFRDLMVIGSLRAYNAKKIPGLVWRRGGGGGGGKIVLY